MGDQDDQYDLDQDDQDQDGDDQNQDDQDQEQFHPCDSKVPVCQNNGECVKEDDDYSCDCATPWVGKNCEFISDPMSEAIPSALVNQDQDQQDQDGDSQDQHDEDEDQNRLDQDDHDEQYEDSQSRGAQDDQDFEN